MWALIFCLLTPSNSLQKILIKSPLQVAMQCSYSDLPSLIKVAAAACSAVQQSSHKFEMLPMDVYDQKLIWEMGNLCYICEQLASVCQLQLEQQKHKAFANRERSQTKLSLFAIAAAAAFLVNEERPFKRRPHWWCRASSALQQRPKQKPKRGRGLFHG